ncbi:MAG TPA: hypothetical protein PK668_09640 [Myxococcota bacterium]|nr:hypothetical protein [Myxococcota bacterium]HRY92755.1 hypothetical protein [Myxococcota bacterium]HSA21463.1 hypothetical protein [Myxococcota bacterium]
MAAPPGGSSCVAALPAEAAGYRPAGPDEVVDRDGLFSLIDGGAEVYRALHVQVVAERRYRKPGAPDILVDVFDMGGSADAFGAYHHDMREGPSAGVGVESERQGGNLFFWKGRCYVSVVPLGVGPGVAEAVLALGQAVAAAIREPGAPPALLALLPAQGRVASQVHYFHDGALLGRLVDLDEPGFLGLGDDTEGLLARYRPTGAPAPAGAEGPALLLIRYPALARAQAAEQAAAAWCQPRGEGRPRCALRRVGALLALVLNAASEEARLLLGRVPFERGARP